MKLGKSALKVSTLCLGTMNFGPRTSEEESFAIMDDAMEAGINFFDNAIYESEIQLLFWLNYQFPLQLL